MRLRHGSKFFAGPGVLEVLPGKGKCVGTKIGLIRFKKECSGLTNYYKKVTFGEELNAFSGFLSIRR
jgi:hypothetical protein